VRPRRTMQCEGGAARPIEGHVRRPDVVAPLEAERQHSAWSPRCHPPHVGIVAVEHGRAGTRERPDHLELLGPGRLEVAERTVVLAGDRRADNDVRPDRPRVPGHFARTGDPHLYDRVAPTGADAQQGGPDEACRVRFDRRVLRQAEGGGHRPGSRRLAQRADDGHDPRAPKERAAVGAAQEPKRRPYPPKGSQPQPPALHGIVQKSPGLSQLSGHRSAGSVWGSLLRARRAPLFARSTTLCWSCAECMASVTGCQHRFPLRPTAVAHGRRRTRWSSHPAPALSALRGTMPAGARGHRAPTLAFTRLLHFLPVPSGLPHSGFACPPAPEPGRCEPARRRGGPAADPPGT